MISLRGTGFARLPDGGRARPDAVPLLQRSHFAVFFTLILLTIGAWGLTLIQAQLMAERMEGVVVPAGADDAMDTMGDMNALGEMDAVAGMGETASPGMADMAGVGWSIIGLAAFIVAWAVMMVAMMLPTLAPMLLLYQTISSTKQAAGAAFVSTWILVIG